MCAFCSTSKDRDSLGVDLADDGEDVAALRTGERPREGSSRRSSLGRAMSARPIASICCSPPDIVPAFWPMRSFRRGNKVKTRSKVRADLGLVGAEEGAQLQVFAHGHIGEDSSALRGTGRRPRRTILSAASLVMGWFRHRRFRPSDAGTSPEIARSVVDLPAPFAPISVTISPGLTSRDRSLDQRLSRRT